MSSPASVLGRRGEGAREGLLLSIKPRNSSDMLSVALLRQLWKVGRKWWSLKLFLKLWYCNFCLAEMWCALKNTEINIHTKEESCNHGRCMVDYAFDYFWNLCSWLDAVAVFVKVITKSCAEGVVLALSVASSTSSKWWSCWDKTLVCRKCLTLAGAGWLSPRYPVELQTKVCVCKDFTVTVKAP